MRYQRESLDAPGPRPGGVPFSTTQPPLARLATGQPGGVEKVGKNLVENPLPETGVRRIGWPIPSAAGGWPGGGTGPRALRSGPSCDPWTRTERVIDGSATGRRGWGFPRGDRVHQVLLSAPAVRLARAVRPDVSRGVA